MKSSIVEVLNYYSTQQKIVLVLHSTLLLASIFIFFILLLFVATPLQHITAQVTNTNENGFSRFDISKNEADELRNQIVLSYVSGEELDTSLFSEIEIKHYRDVKVILYNLIIVFFMLSAYSLWFSLSLIQKKQVLELQRTSTIAQIILVTLIVCIIVSFDFFWISIFHPIFFNDGFMILEPEFISYNLFSHEFFMVSIFLVASATLLSLEGIKYYCKPLLTNK